MTLFRLGETPLKNSLSDKGEDLRTSPDGSMALPGLFGAHPVSVRRKQAHCSRFSSR